MVWIFCPEMTLAQFPEFGFFVQNSRIGVKWSNNRNYDKIIPGFIHKLYTARFQISDLLRLNKVICSQIRPR